MKLNKTFIIRHKETKEQWFTHRGKGQWKASNHAKSAFKASSRIRFDDQDEYELVELKHESEDKL